MAIFFTLLYTTQRFDGRILALSVIFSFSFLLKLLGLFEIYAIIVLLAILCVFVVFLKRKEEFIRVLKNSLNSILFLYSSLLFILYSFYLVHLQGWYFTIFAFLVPFVVFRMVPSKIFEKNIGKILLGIAIIFSFKFLTIYYLVQNDCEITLYEAGTWVKNHTSSKEIIGAFDSGIIGFVSNRTVINLDSVVNPGVLPYLKNKNIFSYIQKRNITVIIDTRGYFSEENKCLRKLKEIKKNNCKTRVIIYKVIC